MMSCTSRSPAICAVKSLLGIAMSMLAMTASVAHASDSAASMAQAVCAACHGANGISISDTIPNLAGQRATYIENQLRALKDGSRKSGVMNAIAAQIPDADIKGLSAHFSAMPGAPAASVRSSPMASLSGSRMAFPANYQSTYHHYLTMNFPATRQVRKFFASPSLISDIAAGRTPADGAAVIVEVYAARLGDTREPIVGADGFFVPEKLLFYTGMAVGSQWGESIPAMLRNGDWHYAVFGQDRAPRAGFSQGECLACHKPLDSTHYLFTHKTLAHTKVGPRQ